MFTALALGAFNDNYYKNALLILTTYTLSAAMGIEPAVLISIASACFILPFFLFSGLAGELADRMPKHTLVRILKITEFVLILMASVALWHQHTWSLLAILFLLGMQAAFFGPAKYAILPELLAREELLQGNAMVEAGTFLSILLGTLVGGLLIMQPNGIIIVATTLIGASALGLWAAYRVPATSAKSPGLAINYNVFASTWNMVRHAATNPGLIFPILGISWFWAIGATYLSQIPVFTKEILGADEKVVTLFNGVFTVGIALGSFFCPTAIRWLRGYAKNLSTYALTGVLVFGLDLCIVGYYATPPSPDALIGLMAYLQESTGNLRITLDLFLMAFCGGVFIVPLYTQLQTHSDEHERARTIASNNVVNALFIATASVLAAILFAIGWNVLHVLFVMALFNLPVIGALAYSAHKKRRH
jgi:acyl-[acyl-carrier-protein]-phospholipid O-acyltransferase/long-chain-fatty-acid--[acyl-carrier-protein] ligase